MSKQEFCLQSLNGRRAMPTDIKYSFDSILRVLACTPACQTCKLQGDVSLVSHSLPFVTLDSGGDRDASSAKTVVRSTCISIRSLNARQRARRQRIGADSAASYVDLGKRASRYTHTHTHTVLSLAATTTSTGNASHSPQTRALSFGTPQLLSLLKPQNGGTA